MITINCPKCNEKTSFEMEKDAIDELGEIYICNNCGWKFRYVNK